MIPVGTNIVFRRVAIDLASGWYKRLAYNRCVYETFALSKTNEREGNKIQSLHVNHFIIKNPEI